MTKMEEFKQDLLDLKNEQFLNALKLRESGDFGKARIHELVIEKIDRLLNKYFYGN